MFYNGGGDYTYNNYVERTHKQYLLVVYNLSVAYIMAMTNMTKINELAMITIIIPKDFYSIIHIVNKYEWHENGALVNSN